MLHRMHKLRQELIYSSLYGRIFLHSILLGIAAGIVCGIAGCAFLWLTNSAFAVNRQHPGLIFLLPAAGLLIVFAYRRAGFPEDRGTNLVLESIRSDQQVPLRTGVLIFFATAATHLCGGSSGREGACLQIGASVSQALGRLFHLDKKDMHLITMCGMSGFFTALMGTPIAACLFSMEVISIGALYHFAFIPCLATSLIVYAIHGALGFEAEAFLLRNMPELGLVSLLRTLGLAVGCSLVAILLCFALHKTRKLFVTKISNAYLRILAGSALLILLTLLFPSGDYNGTGLFVAVRALEDPARPEAFLLKIIFTAVTLGCGFKGGEIVPTLVVGATFGNVIGALLGLPPEFAAALGMIGLFCGVVNCPISSLLLSVELFGSAGLVYFAVICGVCYVLSGYSGLYSSQTILYSKLRPSFINRKAK